MTVGKRAFDIVVALALGLVLLPLMMFVAGAILIRDGSPVLYGSERMKTAKRGFVLWKFRTMRPLAGDSGVSGGDKSNRITATGHWLRRNRLDELPQLWNILIGDMSFVGPRPPLRRYVDLYPALYADVLRARPGVTGLASAVFHKTEEKLLASCETAQETETVYCRRCIPRKARIDLIYAKNQGVCRDARLMLATVFPRVGHH